MQKDQKHFSYCERCQAQASELEQRAARESLPAREQPLSASFLEQQQAMGGRVDRRFPFAETRVEEDHWNDEPANK